MFNSIYALTAFLFSSIAFAQDAAPAKPSMLETFFPMIILIAGFYFLIIRPQAKQRKEHAALLTQLKKGDQVITSSGIYGAIEGLTEKVVTLEVAQGVKIKVLRSQVLGLAKDEVAKQ